MTTQEKVSLFNGATDPDPKSQLTLDEVIRQIREGAEKSRIDKMRKSPWDGAGVEQIKTRLPAISWSGTFSRRANAGLIQHSGLLCADLDHLDGELEGVRAKLTLSPHLFVLFLSPTGRGLKAVFRCPADVAKHSGSYRAIERHVKELTGVAIDQKCKDVARLCFMSYDPELFYNPGATEIEPLPEPERPKLTMSTNVNLTERQRIATELLGAIDWQSEAKGLCDCPNQAAHTTGTPKRDCAVYPLGKDGNNVPTISCFHNSCHGIIEGLNYAFRSRVSKAERAQERGAPPAVSEWPIPRMKGVPLISLAEQFPDMQEFERQQKERLLKAEEEFKARMVSAPPLTAEDQAQIDFVLSGKGRPTVEEQRKWCAELERMVNDPAAEYDVEGLRQLATFDMQPIVFLEKPLWLKSAYHLIAGPKNCGKGTMLSELAARFTRGEFGEDKRNVIWVSGEDSYSTDVRPRIEVAGGDTTRVWVLTVFKKLPELAKALDEVAAKLGNVGLIVLDPLASMVRPGFSENSDSDVRYATEPLNGLADRHQCLVIGVRHYGKNTERGALASVVGSQAWSAVPRQFLGVSDDNVEDDVFHVQVKRGNRLRRGTDSRSFRIEGVDSPVGGEPVTRAVWLEGPGKDVDEMLSSDTRGNTKGRRAQMTVLSMTEKVMDVDGKIESGKVTRDAMAATGACERTVTDAKTALKKAGLIKFVPDKDGSGKVLKWYIKRTDEPRPRNLEE
jgi:hypothetical protein